jgi:integrase
VAKFNFTKSTIEALPLPVKGWMYHYDLKVRGLGIGIGSTGKKSFILYRKLNGIPERITIGRYPDLTIEEARGKASDLNSEIARGANPAQLKRGHKAELTFADLFAEYLDRHSKPSKKTWVEDEKQYKTYLAQKLGSKKLSEIDRASIAVIHNKITKAGHTTAANRVKALISSVFGWAISAGLWEANSVIGIKLNKERSRDRFLQGDELPRFFQALAEEENETMRDYFLLSLLTGARRSNVLAMQWADVSLDRQEWRIGETKNGTPQTVTLSPEAVEVLQNRKLTESGRFVFPGIGSTGHLVEPKKGWERILKRAGIIDLRIHDLRRTLGSWQAKTGASLAIIGKSLNHKNHNTTAIYARLDLDPVRNSVNTATSAMMIAGGLQDGADILNFKRRIS